MEKEDIAYDRYDFWTTKNRQLNFIQHVITYESPEGPEIPCGTRGCLIRYSSLRETVSAVQRRLRRGEAP